MKLFMETERLLLREMEQEDAPELFLLDTEEIVLRYLPGVPVPASAEDTKHLITYVQEQYKRNGTGRLSLILKESNELIGWCGIKLVDDHTLNGRTNYYDLGYRLRSVFWGKGYAGEAAVPCIDFAFQQLKLPELHATVMQGNVASSRLLLRKGFVNCGTFTDEGAPWEWYTLPSPA
jgi:[ribosomal protein S5]-alanine N-acetyltransferase